MKPYEMLPGGLPGAPGPADLSGILKQLAGVAASAAGSPGSPTSGCGCEAKLQHGGGAGGAIDPAHLVNLLGTAIEHAERVVGGDPAIDPSGNLRTMLFTLRSSLGRMR
ncbi:MAG: hypothetical protein HY909_13370 [Deltaproteobacteria bacterium]|nr:hypothetical protein [Deltaproteobacteria bacterium]